jgi:hypothetical protein
VYQDTLEIIKESGFFLPQEKGRIQNSKNWLNKIIYIYIHIIYIQCIYIYIANQPCVLVSIVGIWGWVTMGGTFCRNEHPLSCYLRVDSPVPFSEIKQKLILELPRATSQPENPPKFWKINTEQKQPSTSQYPVVQNGLQDDVLF